MDTPVTKHPFLNDLGKYGAIPPTILVIFGASGDLTARKLLPAIYNLSHDNFLPPDFYLIGFGRKEISDDQFRKDSANDLSQFSRRPYNASLWESVERNTFYFTGQYDNLENFYHLKGKVEEIEKSVGRDTQLMFYISTPPGVFQTIIDNLGESGLAGRHRGKACASKVVIEKPFGRDLQSEVELNKKIGCHFQESQVFRIDHYLGKETVQDLLVQRFANSIFEPIWNFRYVDCVQITVAEALGVGSRAGYYDKNGALRDMIQNHAMQLLSLVAMEPPVSTSPEDIRNEKVKLLKAIQPINCQIEGGDVIRGQYSEGLVDGQKVPGYLSEPQINKASFTETYAAIRLYINNWRWNGVPFYIRSGKRMPRRISEIAVRFRRPPGSLFTDPNRYHLASNTMVIQIQPDEGTTLLVNSKVPGLETLTQPVKMYFRYSSTFGMNVPEAYERLLLDAMMGDGTLFIRSDETEASWKLFTPVLQFWQDMEARGLQHYPSGSWGPLAAERLLWESKHEWRSPGF